MPAAPTITPAPPAPLRSQTPANFTSTAEAFVDWMAGVPDEMNAFGSFLDGLGLTGTSWKAAVRVATTANGTLATAFANGQTVDGVTLVTGDRILLKDQSTGSQNGIYVVAASGAPTRATDMDDASEVLGAGVYVIAGTANGGKLFLNTNTSAVTLGSTSLTFSRFTAAALSQTAECIAGFIASPSDKSYKLVVKIPHAGTITETTTISASGTCTATFKVNSTALGGTANSVSSAEQSQSHASSNTFSAGDDIVLTVSSNSSCADLSFSIKYTRVLD